MHFDVILGPAGLEDEKFCCYGFGRNDGRERSVVRLATCLGGRMGQWGRMGSG